MGPGKSFSISLQIQGFLEKVTHQIISQTQTERLFKVDLHEVQKAGAQFAVSS